jgi:hypothetical protein
MKTLLILLAVMLAGCSNNTAKESWTVTKVNVDGSYIESRYRGEVAQWLLAYFTDTKEVNATSPLSAVTVGSIDSSPDPNSISAVGGVMGKVIPAILGL